MSCTLPATPRSSGCAVDRHVDLSKRCQVQLRGHSSGASQVHQHALCFRTLGKHSCGRIVMASHQLCTAELQSDLEAQPDIAARLQDEGFQFMVHSHLLLHDIVSTSICLDRAVTKVSDDRGVFLRSGCLPQEAQAAGAPRHPALLRVQTLQSSPPCQGLGSLGCTVDWAHHTFALSPFYCYSKSSVFTADTDLVPHLELEMGAVPGSQEVLFYLNMDPKLSLSMSPAYLDHFYLSSPVGATCSEALDRATDSTEDLSHINSSKDVPSWSAIEARAASCPGFVRFTSPDFHVRAFSSTAILFKVHAEGWSSVLEVLSGGVHTWLSWVSEGQSQHLADNRSAVQPAQVMEDLQGMGSRSWAWRRFPRRERAAELMKRIFGKPVIEDYWDSMAGEPRIRI